MIYPIISSGNSHGYFVILQEGWGLIRAISSPRNVEYYTWHISSLYQTDSFANEPINMIAWSILSTWVVFVLLFLLKKIHLAYKWKVLCPLCFLESDGVGNIIYIDDDNFVPRYISSLANLDTFQAPRSFSPLKYPKFLQSALSLFGGFFHVSYPILPLLWST